MVLWMALQQFLPEFCEISAEVFQEFLPETYLRFLMEFLVGFCPELLLGYLLVDFPNIYSRDYPEIFFSEIFYFLPRSSTLPRSAILGPEREYNTEVFNTAASLANREKTSVLTHMLGK